MDRVGRVVLLPEVNNCIKNRQDENDGNTHPVAYDRRKYGGHTQELYIILNLSILVCCTKMVFLISEVDADYRSVLFCFHKGRQDSRTLARPQLLLIPSTFSERK